MVEEREGLDKCYYQKRKTKTTTDPKDLWLKFIQKRFEKRRNVAVSFSPFFVNLKQFDTYVQGPKKWIHGQQPIQKVILIRVTAIRQKYFGEPPPPLPSEDPYPNAYPYISISSNLIPAELFHISMATSPGCPSYCLPLSFTYKIYRSVFVLFLVGLCQPHIL